MEPLKQLFHLERLSPHPVGEGLPLEQLHHDELLSLVLLDRVYGADPLVVERRSRPRLALKPLEHQRVFLQLVGEEFQRHVAAERLLLETVVGEYHEHPAVWMWNLGNEPDLFAHPADAAAGRAWVREMTGLVKSKDPVHPVTTGLHTASLFAGNGLRVDHVFAESDVAVMHGYPMYVDWARDPLDPDFVPYLCALVTALTGKPCLAEEWGGCTSPDSARSEIWEWTAYGSPREQFMAGEEAFAEYVAAVLPRLIEVGSTGAIMWCFADYDPELWDRPPCDEGGAKHERHFGVVRPDGSLKPHAEVIRSFAETGPTVSSPTKTLTLDVTPDQYYLDPDGNARRFYRDW